MITRNTSTDRKMAVPVKYPRFIVIVTVSPAVSPSVVAAILMTQNPSVTAGTLLSLERPSTYLAGFFFAAGFASVPVSSAYSRSALNGLLSDARIARTSTDTARARSSV